MFFIFSILLIPGCLSANVALTNGKFSHDSWRRHVTMNVNDKHWVFFHTFQTSAIKWNVSAFMFIVLFQNMYFVVGIF